MTPGLASMQTSSPAYSMPSLRPSGMEWDWDWLSVGRSSSNTAESLLPGQTARVVRGSRSCCQLFPPRKNYRRRRATMPSLRAIAIIDDDEFVRDALQRLIESVGYATMAFSSADEFINSNCIRDISCLIADVQMPGMTGFDLHDRLIRNEYGIPVI